MQPSACCTACVQHVTEQSMITQPQGEHVAGQSWGGAKAGSSKQCSQAARTDAGHGRAATIKEARRGRLSLDPVQQDRLCKGRAG